MTTKTCHVAGVLPSHTSGVGRVDAHAGYYADARSKGHSVELLITEALGGVHGSAVKMLRRLERATAQDGARDGTLYGRSRTAAKRGSPATGSA